MECHHIVQPQDGGEDVFDNCIPLCFDCHAEVGHYTTTHPKGTKFTPEELRAHRDCWFKKVETGVSDNAPEDYRNLDKNLFQKLVNLLGGSREMTHFRDHDYGAIYPIAADERLREFLTVVELPESDFFDFEMESALADLRDAADAYNDACLGTVWRDRRHPNYVGIPREWREGNSAAAKRFGDAVKLMDEKAAAVWEAYSQFIRTGRLRLRLEMHGDQAPPANPL